MIGQYVRDQLRRVVDILYKILTDDKLLKTLNRVVMLCVDALRVRNKVLFAGQRTDELPIPSTLQGSS